jgi:periplasmic protein CpxP/Spy
VADSDGFTKLYLRAKCPKWTGVSLMMGAMKPAHLRRQESDNTKKEIIMDTNTSQSDTSRPIRPRQGWRLAVRRRWLVLLALPLGAALSMSIARAHGFGDGPRHGKMGEFMQGRIDHLLVAAGASDGQKTQIKAIWEQLRPQLQPLHKQHADIRRQIGEVMTGATIDQARIEQLRRQSVQIMDKTSALVTQGLIASAQILTPEQRKTVLQQIEDHRPHGGPRD